MKVFLILPTQLFENINNLKNYDLIILLEDPYYINSKFHKQKLVLHIASLKFYYDYLKKNMSNARIKYIEFDKINYDVLLKDYLDITMYDPIDKKIIQQFNKYNLKYINNPGFITSNEELKSYYNNLKNKNNNNLNKINFNHTNFYKWQRTRLNILMENNKPLFNKWTYDVENRKPFDKNYEEIKIKKYNNEYIDYSIKYINKYFSNNFGSIDEIYYPVTFSTAKSHLKNFIKYRLNGFGKYQDAISKDVIYGNHSNISCVLNIGLLTPNYIINEIIKYFNKSNNKKELINSIEAIIRQLIGWREYMRFIYTYFNTDITNLHKQLLKNKMPNSWYTSNTELDILNTLINKVNKYAYLHHIERLMIMNNIAILYEIKFSDIYNWFMTCFIDSYDWVMIPNILMNINSLDSKIKYMTRVYIGSDNYIKKMSNFKNKNDFEIINKLYWNFLKKNKQILKKDYGLASQISRV